MNCQAVEEFQKNYMTIADAAKLLMVKPQTFYDHRWRESRGITLFGFGGKRKYVSLKEINSKFRAS